MQKTYIISFDPHKTDSAALHQIIKNSPYISGWWHYLSSAYLVNSIYTLATVHEEIFNKWPKQRFLIMEVDPSNRNGYLPKDAYAWIKKQAQ